MARQRYSKSAKVSGFFDKLKFWNREKKRPRIDVDENEEAERMRLAAEIEANIEEAKKDGGKNKKEAEKRQVKQLQLQQQLLQVQQKETLREIKHLYHPHPRIHVHLRSNPVIYHVKYSDVTRVGRVERRRGRAYTYQADADFVHRDWERAMEEYADKHPVSYNRAAIKGSAYGMRIREKKKRPWYYCCKRRPKPAKKRRQRLQITKEYERQPYKLSVYEIDKKSAYPSVAKVPKKYRDPLRKRGHPLQQQHPRYPPPVYIHYQPYFSHR